MFQVVDVLFLLVTPILVDLLNTFQYSTVHRLVLPPQRTINIAMAMLMIAKTMTLAIMKKACTPCS